jgi:PAS domain S-box-containing protein
MFRSLRTQVLAGQLLLTAMLTLALGLGALQLAAGILERKEWEKVRLLSQSLARETRQTIAHAEDQLERMAAGEELERFFASNNYHLLQALFDNYRDSFTALAYVSPRGVREYAASGPGYTDRDANLAADALVADALDAPNRLVSALRPSRDKDGPLLIMALARRSPFGVNMGAIVAAIPVSRLAGSVRNLHLEQGGYAVLADASGNLLTMLAPNGVPASIALGTPLSTTLAEGRDGVLREAFAGEDSLIGLATLGRHGLATLVVLPREPAIEAQMRGPRRVVLAVAALLAAAAGLLALRWSGGVSRPMVRLAEAVRAVSKGDLTVRAPESGPDEIRTLARAFNAMTADLARSRQQREQAKELLERIIATMNDVLVVVDHQGRVRLLNRAGQGLLGYLPGELEGQPVAAILPVDDPLAAFLESDAAGSLLANGGMAGLEKTLRGKAGLETPVLVSLALLDDPDRQTRGVICLAMDITERKRAEAITRARRAAEAASRAKSEFLAIVSHEMRTPLNIVLGILEHVLESPLPPPLRQSLELALRSGTSLLDGIAAMLDYAGLEAGRVLPRRQVFEPRRLAVEVASRHIGEATAKGLRLTWEVDETVPARLLGDPDRLQQALCNLLSNAVRFTDRGEARLFLGDVSPDRSGPGRRLLAVVSDTGPGVTDAMLCAVFEPFTQEDSSSSRRYGGLGLGLAITRRLARLLGGSLCLVSRPDQGTDVYLSLPVEAAPGDETSL